MRPIGLLALALLLSGCVTTWVMPGVEVPVQERDEAYCRMLSNGVYPNTGGLGGLAGTGMIFAGLAQRRQIMNDCMVAKGYRAAE